MGIGMVIFSCGNNLKNNHIKGEESKHSVVQHPNFNEHIAPIIFENCSPCHHPGGVGPFSLINYKQAKSKAKTIAAVTAKRYMPPWPADPGYTHFKGEKYLTQEQIQTLANWHKDGAPEGPALKKPLVWQGKPYQPFPEQPDLTLKLPIISLFADRQDRFYLVKIPFEMQRDTYVRAVVFEAGQPEWVHHFNGHILMYENGKKKNLFEGKPLVEISQGEYDSDFAYLRLLNDDGTKPQRIHSAVNYLPGVFGTTYPDGIGVFSLKKQFVIVGNDLHYGPADKNVQDSSKVHIYFSKVPPTRETGELMLGTNGVSAIEPPLVVPAGKITQHKTRYKIDQDISVLTVNPHLHMLGTKFIAYAIKPNMDTIPLIRINQWDFQWQYFYTFLHPVKIPAGSVIEAVAEFDNTSNNPYNPNRPPKTIAERLEYGGASMRATDEMFQFILTFMKYKVGDENINL